MVSFDHWLSSIKTNTLSRYLTLVKANHASSNWALVFKRKKDLVLKGTVVLRRLGVKPHNDLALSTEFIVSITTIKSFAIF